MPIKLHYETVTPLLHRVLKEIMTCYLFDPFYLVGGTSLSLRLGNYSVDIDLFTNATYGSIDYRALEEFFKNKFDYYYCTDTSDIVG